MKKMISLRIDETLLAKVFKFIARKDITKTELIERGLELAMKEGKEK